MQVVPLQAVPNQTLQAQLGGQACTLNVYQLTYGLFIDVYVGSALVCAGVICENMTLVVRYAYLGFSGDLVFFDTQGDDDPVFSGFGSRFLLVYLAPSDLPEA